MRALLIFFLAILPAVAQNPTVQLVNLSRVGSADFQVGDRYELVVTAWALQPVSVKITRNSVTDWSPVLGWTDQSGRWATTGQFEKADFGSWSLGWTVGGKLSEHPLQFFVTGPCLAGGQGFTSQSGPNISLSCKTASGEQTFVTPSFGDPVRTPDGRAIPGWANHSGTPEQRMGILIENGGVSGQAGDNAAALITKVIGENALDEGEIRNVIQIVRLAFLNLDRNAPEARNPVATLALLKRLANDTEQANLKRELAATAALFQPL